MSANPTGPKRGCVLGRTSGDGYFFPVFCRNRLNLPTATSAGHGDLTKFNWISGKLGRRKRPPPEPVDPPRALRDAEFGILHSLTTPQCSALSTAYQDPDIERPETAEHPYGCRPTTNTTQSSTSSGCMAEDTKRFGLEAAVRQSLAQSERR
jgi:hypothetical protein